MYLNCEFESTGRKNNMHNSQKLYLSVLSITSSCSYLAVLKDGIFFITFLNRYHVVCWRPRSKCLKRTETAPQGGVIL